MGLVPTLLLEKYTRNIQYKADGVLDRFVIGDIETYFYCDSGTFVI